MRFGVHLPLMDFGGRRFGVEHLVEYVETATALGFDAVADKLDAFRAAGVQRVFLWPITDELERLKRFAGELIPRLDT